MLTSQRVVDVVLKAFNAAAASYGCMNNFTFGDETMGYVPVIFLLFLGLFVFSCPLVLRGRVLTRVNALPLPSPTTPQVL